MSIFTRKSRPKEAEAAKSKQQQNASNGSRPEANRAGAKQAGNGPVSNGPLTAGQRTVQRAQIMAASRVRMNSDSPDYSITGSTADFSLKLRGSNTPSNPGAASGTASPKTAKAPPKTLTKAPPSSTPNAKQRQSSPGLFRTKSSENAMSKDTLGTTPPLRPERAPQDSVENLDKDFLTDPPIQKTPPLPMDSPTLGYSSSPKEGGVQGNAENQPTRNAAYAWVAKLPYSKVGHKSSKNVREDKAEIPRVDSGFVPGLNLPKDFNQEPDPTKEIFTENKSLRPAPSQMNQERDSSRGSAYVSRWDPGPSGSEFARPMDPPSSTSVEKQYDGTQKRALESSPPPQNSRTKETTGRGRKTNPKPVHAQSTTQRDIIVSPASPSAKSAFKADPAEPSSPLVSPMHNLQFPFSQPMRAATPSPTKPAQTNSPNQNAPKPYAEPIRSSTPPPAKPQQRHTPVDDPARTFALPVKPQQKSPKSKKRADGQKTKSSPKSRDSATLMSLTGVDPNWPLPAADSAPLPGQTIVTTPRAEAPEPVFQTPLPDQSSFTASGPHFQGPEASRRTSQPEQEFYRTPAANHRQPESITTNATTTRGPRPPLSVLAGFKVNKRGLILDEEGDAIGELFEGDLIDCVRQRVNDNGDVLDEYGAVVGRVRTIQRSILSPPPQSEMGQFASLQRTISPSMASASSDRRESTTSTPPLVPNGIQSGNNSSTAIKSPDPEENAIIAELDGSTDAEAIPLIDQSEIFIPPFRGSKRSGSPASLSRIETSSGMKGKTQSRELDSGRDTPTGEHRPKKWASRYFDPGPQDGSGTPSSRRNSVQTNGEYPRRNSVQPQSDFSFVRRSTAQTDLTSPVKTTSPATSKQPQSPTTFTSPGGFKAVLGPTLEDLGEEQPSINRASASTPNLGLESSRWGASSPTGSTAASSRRTSVQYPSSSGLAPGLSRGSYQPLRKSPLASYETTPPGSGSGPTEPEQMRALSMKAPSAPAAAQPRIGSKSARVSMEVDDAAPSPEVLKTKAQMRGKSVDAAKTAAKRKSRFSFLGSK